MNNLTEANDRAFGTYLAIHGGVPVSQANTDVIGGWMSEHAKTPEGCAIMVKNGAHYTPASDSTFAKYTYRNRTIPVLESRSRWNGEGDLYDEGWTGQSGLPKMTKAKKITSLADIHGGTPRTPAGTGWDDIFTDEDYE